MKKIFLILNLSQKKIFIYIALLILIVSIFEIAVLSFIKPVIDFFTGSTNKIDNYILSNVHYLKDTSVEIGLLIFFLIFVIRSILSIILSFARQKLNKSINDNLSNKIFTNYLSKDYIFFLRNNSSNLIANIMLEIEKFSYRLVDSISYFLVDSLIISVIVFYLLINFFESTVLLFFLTGTFALTFYFFYKKHFKLLGEKKISYDAKKVSTLQKSFFIIDLIKLSKLENYFINLFKNETDTSSHSTMKMQFISELPRNLMELLIVLIGSSILFILYYYFSVSKQIVLSTLGLFIVSMFRILPSVNRVLYALNNIKYYLPTTEIIYNEIKSIDNNKNNSNNLKSINFNNKIKLENISFSYTEEKENILENLNFQINKNETVGILGKNGAGKSTFLNILIGLLETKYGKIFIDNENIADCKSSYQNKIGYVPQRTLLTDDTIKRNITFNFSDNQINETYYKTAVQKSELVEIINALPQKDNTFIGERGSKLSGGQQQRVSIARALYRDPEIIVFDEATSALDEEAENKVINNIIFKLKGKKTIIIVSHNTNLFKNCDSVYELKGGKLEKIK